MLVKVRDNNIKAAMRQLKKMMFDEGII